MNRLISARRGISGTEEAVSTGRVSSDVPDIEGVHLLREDHVGRLVKPFLGVFATRLPVGTASDGLEDLVDRDSDSPSFGAGSVRDSILGSRNANADVTRRVTSRVLEDGGVTLGSGTHSSVKQRSFLATGRSSIMILRKITNYNKDVHLRVEDFSDVFLGMSSIVYDY